MIPLVAGLLLFLGIHSTRIVADGWRTAMLSRLGEVPWKVVYSIVALAGLWLVADGYAQARLTSPVLWEPPRALKHLATLLTIPAFVLLVASYVPGNRIRAAVRHPMILGVKLWAFAHLLANGRLADLLLFGGFLLWAVLDFRSSRRRDRAPSAATMKGLTRPSPIGSDADVRAVPNPLPRDLAVLAAGLGAWAFFAFRLHASWIGVHPFG